MTVVRRNTAQRSAVLQVLTEAGRPLSPLEILEAAKLYLPSLGIATVYRNIKAMMASG